MPPDWQRIGVPQALIFQLVTFVFYQTLGLFWYPIMQVTSVQLWAFMVLRAHLCVGWSYDSPNLKLAILFRPPMDLLNNSLERLTTNQNFAVFEVLRIKNWQNIRKYRLYHSSRWISLITVRLSPWEGAWVIYHFLLKIVKWGVCGYTAYLRPEESSCQTNSVAVKLSGVSEGYVTKANPHSN